MAESNVEANSSPLATVEEIQRRLLRPPLPSRSTIPFPSISSSSVFKFVKFSKPSATSTLIRLIKLARLPDRDNLTKQGNSSSLLIDLKTKVTLEDYLNPVLLSTVRAKLSGMRKRKITDHGELKRWERDEFKWPIDELKMFKEDSGSKRRNEEAVNLGDDTDLIGEDGYGGDGEVCCTPFGKFEVMALKKFNGGC